MAATPLASICPAQPLKFYVVVKTFSVKGLFVKKALMLGMAYFSCAVGAGFASGQEMLQYYADFGWWGVIGAIIALVLMPLAAMIAMQYGSYFQATSHDRVLSLIHI